MSETILETTLCISSTICLWSALLLFFNWQGVRQRRWFAAVLLFWGIAWCMRLYGLMVEKDLQIYNEVLPPLLIFTGIIASVTFLVWPLMVVNPSGVTPRQFAVFWLPFVLCLVVYYGVIDWFGLEQFHLFSLAALRDHISYFSVWFRLVLCACLLGYLVVTMRLIHMGIASYNRYVEENYSEFERYTIRWMPGYLVGLAIIALLFIVNLLVASYPTFLCHNIVSCAFLGWVSARAMVYNSPFRPEIKVAQAGDDNEVVGKDFSSRFDLYKRNVETWMKNERPYLNPDFNLHEVMERFNLNRTYASRIFNDGFGKSFLLVVRDYRIAYARHLIEENPAIPMWEVAHLCGYSTAQAFHKAFVYCSDGVTPGQFASSVASSSR